MRGRRWLAAAVALALLALGPAAAALTPAQEREARAIEGLLMCPVCEGQTVRESQSPVAQEIKVKIRELLAAGKTRQEILDYFAAEWGERVLAAPPARGLGLVAWLAPAAAAALGAVVLARFLRGRRGERAPAPAGVSPGRVGAEELERRLREYL